MRRVLLAFVLIVACGDSTPLPTTNTWPSVEWHRGSIKIITLPDGTECAVLWEATGHGIDCDWSDR